jgi:sodium/potassium-transporting ATPase subunit beta
MGSDSKQSGPPKFQFYNSETGELLGRNGASWLKITIFYIAYFTFLAGLFMASISVMKTTVNDDKPRLQTRLQIPGLHALPKLDPMDDAQSSRLGDNDGVAIKYDPATEGDNQIYVDILSGIKDEYATQDGGPADFSFSSLGDCGQAPYGYDSNSPCVWIRLNKVIDWTPVGYFAPTEKQGFTSASLNSRMEKDAVYIRCESKEVESGEKNQVNFSYSGGTDGNLESKFYPFEGKKAQPKYQQPIVAVKVGDLKPGVNTRIYCRAFAKNIPIDDRDNLGSVTFEITAGSKTE